MSLRDRIARIHDVFSSRRAPKGAHQPVKDLANSTRTKIVMLHRDVVAGGAPGRPAHRLFASAPDFWAEVHNALQYKLATPVLSKSRGNLGRALRYEEGGDDVIAYLFECSSEHFLDFLELSFKIDHHLPASVIEAINEVFLIEDEPYRLTNFATEEIEEPIHGYELSQQKVRIIKTVAYPQVIVAEDSVVYEEAVAPMLAVLDRSDFRVANDELRKSLEHYRLGKYGDFLSNCGSALESVLQVICRRHCFQFNEGATLGQLLDVVVPGLGLEQVYSEKLKLLATIRNRLSSSHGGGTEPRNPERHYAQLMLTMTAAAIVFLVQVSNSK